MRLLDLYCGSGGAARGYQQAGFYVVGIDNRPQKHYIGEEFILADALEYVQEHGHEFDALHASPPCQLYSVASVVHRNRGKAYPDLIAATRRQLLLTGKPFVIENVPPAKRLLINPITLCGTMFGLGVFRHRCFEATFSIDPPGHSKHNGKIGDGKYFSIAGTAGRWKSWGAVERNVSKGTREEWRQAMGIDWMTMAELTQAIPPAYTYWIGSQLVVYLEHGGVQP